MKIELNTLGSIGLILLSTKIPLRFRKVIPLISPHTMPCSFRLFTIPPHLSSKQNAYKYFPQQPSCRKKARSIV